MREQTATIHTPRDLQQRFAELDRLLAANRNFWQFRPFEYRHLPDQLPAALREWLAGLSPDACRSLEQNQKARIAALTPFIPDAPGLEAATRLPELAASGAGAGAAPARLGYHIPGRKWAQILAFDQALTPAGNHFVEWCAGKGHLGRLLAFRHQRPVESLELQAMLCEEGEKLARALDLPCHHHETDVLAAEAERWLTPGSHAVALHACGKLHLNLIRRAARAGIPALSLSPCCYHLIDEPEYVPLSRPARGSRLRLSRADLKLALQDTVTAGRRERRLRQRELIWRLGFDLLQRELRAEDSYLPCPSVPKSLLGRSFAEYCRWTAEYKGLDLPELDLSVWERAGAERLQLVEKMELVRNLFRRPLEIWLLLDRALFLQEQGYDVRIGTFCDYRLTPRNLFIEAHRQETR